MIIALILARLVALCRNTPRGDRMTASRAPTLTTTVWMIDRIHSHTSDCRSYATPAFGARLTELSQIVFDIADFAYTGPAFYRYLSLHSLLRVR